jgi:hypothetical protein
MPIKAFAKIATPRAQAEEVGTLSPAPALETATAAASNGNELDMFRFALELDKEDFVKKSLALEPAQEKKFGSM